MTDHEVEFGSIESDGTYVKVRSIRQADIQACPHAIMVPEHYRTDGTCFCNEPNDPNMEEWGYVWNPEIGRWDSPDENEEEDE